MISTVRLLCIVIEPPTVERGVRPPQRPSIVNTFDMESDNYHVSTRAEAVETVERAMRLIRRTNPTHLHISLFDLHTMEAELNKYEDKSMLLLPVSAPGRDWLKTHLLGYDVCLHTVAKERLAFDLHRWVNPMTALVVGSMASNYPSETDSCVTWMAALNTPREVVYYYDKSTGTTRTEVPLGDANIHVGVPPAAESKVAASSQTQQER